ncbi:MAG: peptidoglycan-binding protein, partial [Betaproteobacteria bacterium]
MSGLVTAKLFELNDQGKPGQKKAIVQFNPETLKVTYANQIVEPPAGSGSQSDGSTSRQFVGAGPTKLSRQIWFDINAPMPGTEGPVDGVRRLTQKVTELMKPEPTKQDKKVYVPPMGRFEWGSFKFDGIIDSLDESLE